MARATPKRDARGRFVKKTTAARRKAPARRRAAPKRRAAPRRNTYSKNPKAPDIVTMLMDGSIAASQVLVGKAVARSIPEMTNLPKQGNVGLAVQAAVALASGYLASMFLSRGAAAAIMAGGLTAPIETLIVANNVPFLSDALAPSTAIAAVNGYSGTGRYSHAGQIGTGRYSHAGRSAPVAALMGFPDEQEHDDCYSSVY